MNENENERKKVPCTKNDLAKVEEIFSNVIHEKLSNSNINLDKIAQEFRHLLDISFVIQPSPEDDQESQELKGKIEKSQKKALRLKNTLDVHKNQIIVGVRGTIEKMLEENRPKIEDFSEEDIFEDEIKDEDFKNGLSILDKSIEDLLLILSETNSKMQMDTERFHNNANDIESFLKSCS